jgi:hypothetical protein
MSMAGVQAYMLDWTAVDYTAQAMSQTFTNVGGSGVDMTFSWLKGANPAVPSDFYDSLPNDEEALSIYPGAEPGLWYATDNNVDVSLVITFSELVSNVSFGIYDIDGDAYNRESVRIKGFDELGAAVDLLNYAVGYGSEVTYYTDGTANFGVQFINSSGYDTDPGEIGWEESMAMVSIDSGVELSKVGIAFLNNDGLRGQILTNISFVPEPATMLLMGLGSAVILKRKR